MRAESEFAKENFPSRKVFAKNGIEKNGVATRHDTARHDAIQRDAIPFFSKILRDGKFSIANSDSARNHSSFPNNKTHAGMCYH